MSQWCSKKNQTRLSHLRPIAVDCLVTEQTRAVKLITRNEQTRITRNFASKNIEAHGRNGHTCNKPKKRKKRKNCLGSRRADTFLRTCCNFCKHVKRVCGHVSSPGDQSENDQCHSISSPDPHSPVAAQLPNYFKLEHFARCNVISNSSVLLLAIF